MHSENIIDDLERLAKVLLEFPKEKQAEIIDLALIGLKSSYLYAKENEFDFRTKLTADKLKETLRLKRANSNIERTLIFAVELNNAGIKKITANEIEYCYQISELSPPGNLIQNLRDTCSKRYSYLAFVQDHYEVTNIGRDFYEKM